MLAAGIQSVRRGPEWRFTPARMCILSYVLAHSAYEIGDLAVAVVGRRNKRRYERSPAWHGN